MAAVLDGMEQWRLGVRCVVRDTRRRSTLSGVVVASMAERPDKVDASVHALRMDRGKMEVTALCSVCVWYSLRVRRTEVLPSPAYVAWMGHPALDVRLSCDVCLVFGPDIRHAFIKGIGVATCVV